MIRYAINCSDNDLGWWYDGRCIDWLVDGKTLTNDNTILIAEHPLSHYYGQYDPESRTITTPIIQRPKWLHSGLWWLYIRVRYPLLRHVIFCNTVGWATTLRNKVIKYLGFVTWFYLYSANTGDMFGDEKSEHFANMNYAHYLCWHKQQQDYFQKNGAEGTFHIVGVPFADIPFRERTAKTVKPGVVVFYDTSFPNKYTSTEDYKKFLEYIIEYKRMRPLEDVYLKLMKPMLPGMAERDNTPYADWDAGIENYTCNWEDTPNGDIKRLLLELPSKGITILKPSYSNNTILKEAGFIIAMPYTSIVLEAVACGCLAVWWNGNKFPQDYVPFRDGRCGERIRSLLK